MNSFPSRYLLLLSLAAYIACLPMVAFCLGSECLGSWNVLIYGWMAMPLHRTHLIWLANPILLIAWVFIAISLRDGTTRPMVAALVTSGLALVLATWFLLPIGLVTNLNSVSMGVTSRAAGYWLWLAGMAAAFAAAMLLPVQAPSRNSS